jgi:hypothetical protein
MAPAAEESEKAKCSTAAFPKLFVFGGVGSQVSPVTMSCLSLRNVALFPCLPLDIKDLLRENVRFFDGGLMEGFFDGDGLIGWLLLSYARDWRKHGTVQV